MAGIARIVVGVILVIIGIATLIFLIGILPLIIGIALIAWGLDARRREAAEQRQQQSMAQQTAILQQMAATQAMQSHLQAAPLPQFAASQGGTSYAERFCPACGAGNLKVSTFCQKCGKPLPPAS